MCRLAVMLSAVLMVCSPMALAQEPAKAPADVTVLAPANVWRYHVTLRDQAWGTAADAAPSFGPKDQSVRFQSDPPPTDWAAPTFDDSCWFRTPGVLYGGYGFQQPTRLATICMRGIFTVDDPAAAKPLRLRVFYRGGMVAYVNGKEIGRANLPTGELTAESFADDYPVSVSTTGPDEKVGIKWGWGDPQKYKAQCEQRIRTATFDVPAKLLVAGRNVVAIRIQRSATRTELKTVTATYEARWNSCGLNDVRLTAAGPGGGLEKNAAWPSGLRVWTASAMQPVYDGDRADMDEVKPIRIVGSRNGTFSGQVVVTSDAAIDGLKAEVGDLTRQGGKEKIAASSILMRYPATGGIEGSSGGRYWPIGNVERFDGLFAAAPATRPLVEKRDFSSRDGKMKVGPVQPVWLTVTVPADAIAGSYSGEVRIAATGLEKPVVVPVNLTVCNFVLPKAADFITHADFIQSPETVAMYYKVPLWSDKHFALMAETFKQLGRVGNKTVYIPMIAQSHFGNEQTMVRFVADGNGGYKGDFSIMERYLDIVEKNMGKPQIVVLYAWDHFAGGGYFGGKGNSARQVPIPVTLLDPASGKTSVLELPRYEEPASRAAWKPVIAELSERLKKRDLDKAMMIGCTSDIRASQEVVNFWKELLPKAPWVCMSHGLATRMCDQPIGYSTTVWNARFALDPSFRHDYGWKNPFLAAHFNRDMTFSETLTENRVLPEFNISGAQRGFGRMGADFWPALEGKNNSRHMLVNRYPGSNWAQLSVKTVLLAPGTDGAVSTARFEMIVEGMQECEAKIAIEKALLDPAAKAKLGADLATRCQKMLDDRIRACTWTWDITYPWYLSSDWQLRSERLYSMAAEVAAALAK